MRRLLIVLFVIGFFSHASAYDKLSLVERFTNCSCGPCATLNNAWYNVSTANLINNNSISHIIYHVDWPSACDPMHLLNVADNSNRTNYYGVNAVPWIEVNASYFNPNLGQSAFETTVTSGNSQYSPFKISLTPERFSNDVINIHVKIIRDPNDNTTFGDVRLRVALTEKDVEISGDPCCNNGETIFHSVCRKMLPDAKGTEFSVPAPGDSVELDLLYIPTTEFIQAVNLNNIRVVSFIQNDDTQQMYQSAMENLVFSNRINAAFKVEENLGASPLVVNFMDYSTATDTTNITSWEWDFDDDGTIDSQDPNPTWTYAAEQSFSVSLTVSDGNQQHTRVLSNYITVLGASSDILVVNGIAYPTYPTEMANLYNSSACFGNHQVDIWDLFGDQGFDYNANPNIQQVNLLNRDIPNSILNLYSKVIWIGNSYAGDEAFYDPQQVLDYLGQGGNFLLATREGADFFDANLRSYCGIASISGLTTITQLIALDDSLTDMSANPNHTRVQLAYLDPGSEAIPIFDNDTNPVYVAGFRLQRNNDGAFIYIAGRPYRFDNNASFQNYDYIIDNWLDSSPVSIDGETAPSVITSLELFQNHPNPFNPETKIKYALPAADGNQRVTLNIYNQLGQRVRTLVNTSKPSGIYEVTWTGQDDNGKAVASGIYFYQLVYGDHHLVKKMVLLR